MAPLFAVCTGKYDIIIMLDFSGSLLEYYKTMIRFVRHVIYGLDFRFDRTRLALAAYAEEIRVCVRDWSLISDSQVSELVVCP